MEIAYEKTKAKHVWYAGGKLKTNTWNVCNDGQHQ